MIDPFVRASFHPYQMERIAPVALGDIQGLVRVPQQFLRVGSAQAEGDADAGRDSGVITIDQPGLT